MVLDAYLRTGATARGCLMELRYGMSTTCESVATCEKKENSSLLEKFASQFLNKNSDMVYIAEVENVERLYL